MSDMRDHLNVLARKLDASRETIETEEATKTALIMPFIQDVLGFDVFDLNEVIPEFVADVGLKKGEKIDFAILNQGEVAMLIECKRLNESLSLENASQLYRYFSVTTARIAILTNGNEYRFYTDLDAPNKMDHRPFLELRLDDLDSTLVPETAKLTKRNFDLESVLTAAEELKYVSAAKRVFATEAKEISWDMASLVLGRIYSGRLTQRIRNNLTPLVQKGLQQFVSDQVNYRLRDALNRASSQETTSPGADPTERTPIEPRQSAIETTEQERQGLRIIQAIVASDLDVTRVVMRDAKSYCAILLDDNNRKTICRLHFNNAERLRMSLFDEDKTESMHDLQRVEDIYSYAQDITASALRLAK